MLLSFVRVMNAAKRGDARRAPLRSRSQNISCGILRIVRGVDHFVTMIVRKGKAFIRVNEAFDLVDNQDHSRVTVTKSRAAFFGRLVCGAHKLTSDCPQVTRVLQVNSDLET
jgi:hypothetical protein